MIDPIHLSDLYHQLEKSTEMSDFDRAQEYQKLAAEYRAVNGPDSAMAATCQRKADHYLNLHNYASATRLQVALQ